MFALVAVYLVGSAVTTTARAEALRHVETTLAAGVALMLFATFGPDLVKLRLFRTLGVGVCGVGIIGVNFAHLPKNITGGAIVYLIAFVVLVLSSQRRSGAWMAALVFFAITLVLAVALDFRSLIAYTALFLLAFAASGLTRPKYWIFGVLGTSAVIGAVTWYFLHAYTSRLAISISQLVLQNSGRRATSGRDVLWPAIVNYVHGSQLFGRGVDKLPSSFLQTSVSSSSFYMQTYLQLGFFGLVMLLVLLLVIWARLSRPITGPTRFGSALFLMFVVHNGTETLMFQNGLIASIPAWCCIGLTYAEIGARPRAERSLLPSAASASLHRTAKVTPAVQQKLTGSMR